MMRCCSTFGAHQILLPRARLLGRRFAFQPTDRSPRSTIPHHTASHRSLPHKRTGTPRHTTTYALIHLPFDHRRAKKQGFVLNPVLGPEPVTGSSRMKGGTATKVLLEALCYGHTGGSFVLVCWLVFVGCYLVCSTGLGSKPKVETGAPVFRLRVSCAFFLFFLTILLFLCRFVFLKLMCNDTNATSATTLCTARLRHRLCAAFRPQHLRCLPG
jgi:hypothetical protein